MDLIFGLLTKKWKEGLISLGVLLIAAWGLVLTFKSADAAASQDPSPRPVVEFSPIPSVSPTAEPSPTPSPSPSPSPTPSPSDPPAGGPSTTPEATSAASKGGVNGDVAKAPDSGPEMWALVWSVAAVPFGISLSGFGRGKVLKLKKQPINFPKLAHDLVDQRKNHHTSK